MALHELATNAVRHGSLVLGLGQCRCRMGQESRRERRCKVLHDMEGKGGPPVSTPGAHGFWHGGDARGVAEQPRGDHPARSCGAGLAWRLECPLAAVLEARRDASVDSDTTGCAAGAGRILLVGDEPLVALELTQSCATRVSRWLVRRAMWRRRWNLSNRVGLTPPCSISISARKFRTDRARTHQRGAPFVTLSWLCRRTPARRIFEGVKAFNKPVRTGGTDRRDAQDRGGQTADR